MTMVHRITATLSKYYALRAVPIAARVVRWLLVAARIAHDQVPAERGGPAGCDIPQDLPLLRGEGVPLHEGLAVEAHDVRDLQTRGLQRGAARTLAVPLQGS